jgi:integration host factor subunit alpha
MKLTKSKISQLISKNNSLSVQDSSKIINFFISKIIKESKQKSVKLSGFGTFYIKKTIKRTGRNPLTRETYVIEPRKKLAFKASNNIKEQIN